MASRERVRVNKNKRKKLTFYGHGGARPNTGGPRPGSGMPKGKKTWKTLRMEKFERIAESLDIPVMEVLYHVSLGHELTYTYNGKEKTFQPSFRDMMLAFQHCGKFFAPKLADMPIDAPDDYELKHEKRRYYTG